MSCRYPPRPKRMPAPEGFVWWPGPMDPNRLAVRPATRDALNDYLKANGYVLPADLMSDEERAMSSKDHDA